jgi:hypothetical protein
VLGGMRFIDDMEFSFRTLSEAEGALALLEGYLNEYELQLNGTKTVIVALPDEIESIHVTNLRPHIPTTLTASPTQWIDYFNRAMVAAKLNLSAGVLRYAVGALKTIIVHDKSWTLAQSLLWQCILIDPGSLRLVVDVLIVNKHSGNKIDLDIGSIAINSLIQSSASVGHGSEVLWSIWAAMVIGLDISLESQLVISTMDDCLVACAATIAKERNVFSPTFESSLWASWIVEDAFNQDHWIFVYEALRRGWYESEVKTAKLSEDSNASFLLASGVTFINDEGIDKYSPANLLMLYSGGEIDY